MALVVAVAALVALAVPAAAAPGVDAEALRAGRRRTRLRSGRRWPRSSRPCRACFPGGSRPGTRPLPLAHAFALGEPVHAAAGVAALQLRVEHAAGLRLHREETHHEEARRSSLIAAPTRAASCPARWRRVGVPLPSSTRAAPARRGRRARSPAPSRPPCPTPSARGCRCARRW